MLCLLCVCCMLLLCFLLRLSSFGTGAWRCQMRDAGCAPLVDAGDAGQHNHNPDKSTSQPFPRAQPQLTPADKPASKPPDKPAHSQPT